jgi:hypothetical protein
MENILDTLPGENEDWEAIREMMRELSFSSDTDLAEEWSAT